MQCLGRAAQLFLTASDSIEAALPGIGVTHEGIQAHTIQGKAFGVWTLLTLQDGHFRNAAAAISKDQMLIAMDMTVYDAECLEAPSFLCK